MTMMNSDSPLEMAASRYADLIIRSLDPDVSRERRRREPVHRTSWPLRHTAAALLRRLADAIQPEPAIVGPVAVAR